MKDYNKLEDLVQRVQVGDESAFIEVYNLFSKHVFYNAIKLLGNEADAKDALQEVMLYLYSHIDDIKNPRGLPVYLYRATYHHSMAVLRSRDKILPTVDDDLLLSWEPEKNTEFLPEEYVESAELRDYLLSVLDDLHPNYKVVLLMYYYDGLSSNEIADILGINSGAVRVRLKRGRDSLKRKLEQNSKKKGVKTQAMAVPVLTRVMQQNADALFTPEINEHAWQHIAGQLGLAAAAATTVASATSMGAGTTATAISGTKVVAGLLVAATTALSIWGLSVIDSPIVPTGLPPIMSSGDTQTSDISPVQIDGADIDPSGQIPNSALHSTTGEAMLPDNSRLDPHTPSGSAEVPTSAELSGTPFPVHKTSDILYYPVGTNLTFEQIYRDAGITGAGSDANQITVTGLDLVDPTRPDKYLISLHFPATDLYDGFSLVLIIVIER